MMTTSKEQAQMTTLHDPRKNSDTAHQSEIKALARVASSKYRDLMNKILVMAAEPQGFRVASVSKDYTGTVISSCLYKLKNAKLLFGKKLPTGKPTNVYFDTPERLDAYFKLVPESKAFTKVDRVKLELAPGGTVVYAANCKFTTHTSLAKIESWEAPKHQRVREGSEDFLRIPSRGIG